MRKSKFSESQIVGITTTERYDNQKLKNLQLAVAKLESGKSNDLTESELNDWLGGRESLTQPRETSIKTGRFR